MSLYDDCNPQHLEYLEFHRANRRAREERALSTPPADPMYESETNKDFRDAR